MNPVVNLAGPSFLVYNMRIVVVPFTQSCWEDRCVNPFKVRSVCGDDFITDVGCSVLKAW